jgi:hypothetical protein
MVCKGLPEHKARMKWGGSGTPGVLNLIIESKLKNPCREEF